MKKFTFSLAKLALVPALVGTMLTFNSCQKEEKLCPSKSQSTMTTAEKRAKMRNNVVKVLKEFTASTSGGTTPASSGSAGSWASAIATTTYSTPTANVYQWSDPTTGTTFQFSEATGGGGLGQLSYDGKSADYQYVLYIKSGAGDPTWDGFFGGNELRGVVAIAGDLSDISNIVVSNFSIFLVGANNGDGSYKFIDFNSAPDDAQAIGEIIDLTNVSGGGSLDGLGDVGDIYVTSGGHITVGSNSFEMESDAKVMKASTGVESTLEGMIMFE